MTASSPEGIRRSTRCGRAPALWLLALAVGLPLAPLAGPLAVHAQAPQIIRAWDLPGSPEAVSAASSTDVWFTLPAERAIGRLTLDDAGTATVSVHDADCAASDLLTAGGAVWWICDSGERLWRRDLASGATNSYALITYAWIPIAIGGGGPSEGSEAPEPADPPVRPHLAARSAAPGEIWFTLPSAMRVGRLTVGSDPAEYTLSQWAMPAGARQPHDIALESATKAWVTVPDQGRLYQLNTALNRWVGTSTGAASRPWSITIHEGAPWFTDPAGDRVGHWNPSTLTIVLWHSAAAGSYPSEIASGGGAVWFSEPGVHRLARLDTASSAAVVQDVALPGAAPSPSGVSVDDAGGVWAAAPGSQQLVRWQPPYFWWLHLPFVIR